MKYCSNCGSPVTDEDYYCPCCGSRLHESVNNTHNTNSNTSVNPTNSSNSANSTNSTNNDDPFATLDDNGTTANANSSKNDNAKQSEKSEPKPDYNEPASTLAKVLSFINPTVGLILFAYWCRDYKVKAREVGKMALISYTIVTIIAFVFGLIARSIFLMTPDVPAQIVSLFA